MYKHRFILLSTLMLLFISSYVMLAYATDNKGSLKSGYAVTSNYHGIPVPPGATVVVTAMTTDPQVDKVTFIWKNPAGQIVFQETNPVFSNGTKFGSKTIYYAISTYSPTAIGDWGVQAKFLYVYNSCRCTCTITIARRATSFHVIPEIPVIGTVGASAAMIAGFAWKMKRKATK